mmetsp:Transcript_11584/g.24025  ORF Transcript_11584/g.24025 Transcript_11584/m.24025 type:complete len:216 (-) Transcript_11584:339-986(-)
MSTPDTQLPETNTPANEGPSFLDAMVTTESNVASSADENPSADNDNSQEAVSNNVSGNDNTNDDIDIESHQRQSQTEPQQLSPSPEKSQSNVDRQHEDDTASLFSFDSYEKQPRIPLRLQNLLKRKNNNDSNDPESSNTVPFPSVINRDAAQDQGGSGGRLFLVGQDVDVPCRCLFFTVKETICMILSALGCAVFLCGLILLCMYLEGSIFVDND